MTYVLQEYARQATLIFVLYASKISSARVAMAPFFLAIFFGFFLAFFWFFFFFWGLGFLPRVSSPLYHPRTVLPQTTFFLGTNLFLRTASTARRPFSFVCFHEELRTVCWRESKERRRERHAHLRDTKKDNVGRGERESERLGARAGAERVTEPNAHVHRD